MDQPNVAMLQRMTERAPLDADEVKRLVHAWFEKLDAHAPVEELLPLLADEDLSLELPEGTVRGHAGFRAWYGGVTRKFFDELHELVDLRVEVAETEANVTLVVNWQARTWTPPAASSLWLGFDAAQRWLVRSYPAGGRPVIVHYVVDSLTPMQGSASLGAP
ncbi:nuclear transport factor 2 family protein [Sorangium sp. So ce381]|uniref:nuclear transport factor 2 family protein n=1 Tax=Sorangium sp. So ce381 TaxID=3133307 RepID=UPI003F5C27FF